MNKETNGFIADFEDLKQKYTELEKKVEEEKDAFKKREEELKIRLLFFEGIANSTVDGFLVVSPFGQKILQTQRTNELWKIPQEVIDDPDGMKQVEHVMHMTVDPKKFLDEIKYQIEHPYEKRLDEIELIDGTILERYSSPVIDSDGKNHGRIYTFHDITQRKESEKNLVQLNGQKDRFISVLSHDLRGPIGNLSGISGMLLEDIHNYSIEKIEEMIKVINVSAKKTFELLEDTLTWASVSLDKVTFEPKTLNVNEIISEVLDILEPLAREKSISLIDNSYSGSNVYADVYMLKAILRNLTSNAIKFTNKGGKIEIKVSVDSSNTTIQVSDNGIGIPIKTLEKLFNISTIYSTKGTASETGTGLGLMLCKEFIEKHGGKIWIDSQVNAGTTVSFSIPGKEH